MTVCEQVNRVACVRWSEDKKIFSERFFWIGDCTPAANYHDASDFFSTARHAHTVSKYSSVYYLSRRRLFDRCPWSAHNQSVRSCCILHCLSRSHTYSIADHRHLTIDRGGLRHVQHRFSRTKPKERAPCLCRKYQIASWNFLAGRGFL